jgi:hypothetical protein
LMGQSEARYLIMGVQGCEKELQPFSGCSFIFADSKRK